MFVFLYSKKKSEYSFDLNALLNDILKDSIKKLRKNPYCLYANDTN